jgi:hypothetical protein
MPSFPIWCLLWQYGLGERCFESELRKPCAQLRRDAKLSFGTLAAKTSWRGRIPESRNC